MDLIYSEDNSKKMTISLATGQPVYEVSTQEETSSSEPTMIKKFQNPGDPPVDIGQVKMRSFHSDVCELLGRDIRPRKGDLWSRSFTSLVNGQEYTWDQEDSKATLTDEFENTVAIYKGSHSEAPVKLSVTPEGMSILDEIVVTCVYHEQQCEEDAEKEKVMLDVAKGVGKEVGKMVGKEVFKAIVAAAESG
ncbi:hypothetical protein PM082_011396 [Marasmius tenuissimus]|nr:hypothetical protein PM082_011396 [Marasmius tenuissimus]